MAVDCDDVVGDFTLHILACIKKEFGIAADYESIEWADLFDSIIPGGWDWLRKRDWLWAKMPATEGSIGGVAQLRTQGHYVELLTSKPDWGEWAVWAFLGKWRIPFNSVTIVSPGQKKHEVSKADVLVDDNIDNCLGFVEDGRRAILYSRPWNRDAGTHLSVYSKLVRADNWDDVLKAVELMSRTLQRKAGTR